MGKWAVSMYSKAFRRARIDAEYHSHEARNLDDDLVRQGIALVPLKRCCSRITSGHTPLRHDLTKGDVVLVTVECVSPLQIDFSGSKRVLRRHYDTELKRVALTKSSVLVTIKRRIAQASPCYQLNEAAVVNQDVAVLELKNEWKPGFIAAYLNCTFGQRFADRERTEQMNPYLPVGKLSRLLVPLLPQNRQDEVDEIVTERFRLLQKSEALSTQAQQLMEAELGLDKLKFEKPMGYTAQFSELEVSRRFDPEHYTPEFKQMLAHFPPKASLRPLRNFSLSLQSGVQPAYSAVGSYNVVNSKHVGTNVLHDDAQRSADWKNEADLAYKGDVLLNATGRGTLGRSAVVEANQPVLYDVCIIRIRVRDIDPHFCAAFLNSRFGQVQMEMHTRGTSGQLHLYTKDAAKILVWDAPKPIQEKIGDLIRSANDARRQSATLLDQAKRRVEELIEEAVR